MIANIAWIAIRELLYEKVFYVLVLFCVMALGLSLLLGQLTYAEQAKLTIDFMLAGIEISMVLFSVFMGITLFQRELTMGSVSMVLSKPINRSSFLLGKFIGQVLVQAAVIAGMTAVTILVVAQQNEPYSAVAIAQACALIFLEVFVLSSITYFFAVNAKATTTAGATLAIFWLGHFRAGAVTSMGQRAASNPVWSFARSFIPDLEVFNLKALASYGFAISTSEILYISLYAVTCVVFFLVLAIICFDRKDILT